MLEYLRQHPVSLLAQTSFFPAINNLPRTGIGPETFAFISSDGGWGEDCHLPSPAQLAFNAEHGFYVTRPHHVMRPEVLESNFYAFRVTGNTKYLDRAASAIASFNKHLAVEHGFAGLNDVTNFTAGYADETQSFWFAEVLKYLYVVFVSCYRTRGLRLCRYLTFDDPQHISLDECERKLFHGIKVANIPFGRGV
jgi:mannosyl-oligosaccharide alpha-1,2-mannosidase